MTRYPSRAWLLAPCLLLALQHNTREDTADTVPKATASTPSKVVHSSITTTASIDAAPPTMDETPDNSPDRPRPVWREQELLVQIRDGEDFGALSRRYGVHPKRPPGASGFGVIEIPSDIDQQALLQALLDDGAVAGVSAHAAVYGADNDSWGWGSWGDTSWQSLWSEDHTASDHNSSGPALDGELTGWQWHLSDIGLTEDTDLSGIVIAVLDSGVSYTLAESLSAVPIVAPLDRIDDDEMPLDEHWHGTHIASLIASDGAVQGVARGVSLMPVRVLDAQNQGLEIDLIEGIHHAIDNGADIINMSLAFGQGYVPSPALRDALERAAAAGVVMIAAAGNDGEMAVAWPASSPHVVAVGAYGPDQDGEAQPTDYTNFGPRLDVSAPGGDMNADRDNDGYPDGLLAETIVPGDPSRTGHYFAAGSSQAAALVSGAAAHLIANGVGPEQVTAVLQSGSRPWSEQGDEYGVGLLDVQRTLDVLWATDTLSSLERDYYVTTLPWLAESEDGDSVQARARVALFSADGSERREFQTVHAVLTSEAGAQAISCNVGSIWSDTDCELAGPWVEKWDEDGNERPQMWSFEILSVEEPVIRMAWHPRPALMVTDGVEILLTALDGQGLASSPLGFRWQQAVLPGLGRIAPATVMTSSGAGFASSPLGVVFNDVALKPQRVDDLTVSLDGTGLASSPLGVFTFQRMRFKVNLGAMTLGGVGLASSPLGWRRINVLALNGFDTNLGVDALSVLSGAGDAVQGAMLGIDSAPVWLDTGHSPQVDLTDTTVQSITADGGWTDELGLEPAALIRASIDGVQGSTTYQSEPVPLVLR